MKSYTIAFDLDGTLVDTAPDLIGTLNHVLGEAGLDPIPESVARPGISHGARAMLEAALDHHGREASDGEIDDLFARFIIRYGESLADTSRPFPGVRAALEALQSDGVQLGVCTNKREDLTRRLLDALDLTAFFGAIVGRDTLDVCKPHPRHLTETIARAGGELGRALMVGDSETDVKTARAAGVPIIGVTFGYTDTPMQALEPDRLMDHYSELAGLIADLTEAAPEAHSSS